MNARRELEKVLSVSRCFVASLIGALALSSGCATHTLWNEADLDTWNEPAERPNLHLFRAEEKSDFLIVYDEYRERNEAVSTRAYFLNTNRGRIAQQKRPRFVKPALQKEYPTVPILLTNSPSANSPICWSAYILANGQTFKVYSGRSEITSDELPVYNDGLGPAKRIVLTPIAIACDMTVIGGYLFAWFYSGYQSP